MFFFAFSLSQSLEITGFVHDDFSITVVDGIQTNGSCWAISSDNLTDLGNIHFSVHGREGETKQKMMYCAGYLEGKMLQERIYQAYINNIYVTYGSEVQEMKFEKNIEDFYENNYKLVKEMIEANPDVEYWTNVDAILRISDGMFDGYSQTAPADEIINHSDFYIHNFLPDIFDIKTAIGTLSPTDPIRGKCTGGIRLLPDYSDIFVMHNAWSDYRNAFGLTLDYDFPVPGFAARRVSITILLGMVSSLDDFYLADSGLIVFETSLMSQDTKMLSDYINSHKKSLFCGMRSLLAMFTAHNGTEWAEIFLKYNSGTYNNDYFVTDVNKFKRKSKPTKDLVTLIEQLPSETPYVFDVTKNLTDDGFIASFNVPFTEEVYHICQYDKVENTSEYYHPYKLHPRYLISARELPTVSTFDEMKSFARFNNFKRDPYSEGNPMNTIASREDLKGFIPSGAFNQKAVKASLGSTIMEYEFCGAPTNESEDTPTFVWSKGPFANLPRVGLPDVLNFTWLTINGEEFDKCSQLSKDECIKQNFCGYCGKSKKCMAGNDEGPFNGKCYNKWETQFTSNVVYIVIISVIVGVVVIGGVILAIFFYKRSRKTTFDEQKSPLI